MTNLSDTERKAITGLIDVARAAFTVADDAEDDGAAYQIKVLRTHADALGAALDTLDELPDDQPGYAMGPSNKAEWALRRILGLGSQLAEIASWPVCATCGGNGMVGGLTPHSGYDTKPCPDCAEKY